MAEIGLTSWFGVDLSMIDVMSLSWEECRSLEDYLRRKHPVARLLYMVSHHLSTMRNAISTNEDMTELESFAASLPDGFVTKGITSGTPSTVPSQEMITDWKSVDLATIDVLTLSPSNAESLENYILHEHEVFLMAKVVEKRSRILEKHNQNVGNQIQIDIAEAALPDGYASKKVTT